MMPFRTSSSEVWKLRPLDPDFRYRNTSSRGHVIAGTRITVESILEKLGAGESVESVVDSHPRLSHEAVLAALAFAAEALRADGVYPSPTEAG
jgi:uncharacterized protein (DUF433 family)